MSNNLRKKFIRNHLIEYSTNQIIDKKKVSLTFLIGFQRTFLQYDPSVCSLFFFGFADRYIKNGELSFLWRLTFSLNVNLPASDSMDNDGLSTNVFSY
jgi:hypothetical protein